MDKIIVKDAAFPARVGVRREEREKPQEIFVDIEVSFDTKEAGRKDDLSATLSYLELHERASRVIARRSFHLIEAIAEEVAADVLEHFGVSEVLVRVKKPRALASKNVRYPAVEITRVRDG